ncbi:FAD/NAD(P)-binding domain-containing protein [Hypoxylon sp. FL1150]|nr:FAD/NAD(P)-binding domain-containing protein [Hypoxylon sp. FL1150]
MSSSPETFDVVVVGAGVSGINCAYRIKTELPGASFTVLEGRDDIGGTWDFFKFPGVRSDSDLYTYAFSWHLWPHENPIGQGAQIKQYIADCVSEHEIDRFIRLRHKVLSADWSSETQEWRLLVAHDGTVKDIRAGWLVMGTGYYDYTVPLETEIPGLDTFKGKIIHPQFWPQDYDYSDRKIAIVGSGATAVSLLPKLAEKAAQVTVVQRSPTWVISSKHLGPTLSSLQRYLPFRVPFLKRWDRAWVAVTTYLTTVFCRRYPARATALVRDLTIPQLPKGLDADLHFKPRYSPWEQRLCLALDGDYFEALGRPNAGIVTGVIDGVDENAIRMRDGTVVEVDTIVKATGLRMRLGGDVALTVDGREVTWGGRFVWNGAMVQDVPNMVYMVGYTNGAWTLGADCTAYILVRLVRLMESKGARAAVPRVPEKGFSSTERFFQLSSTYIRKAESEGFLPSYGDYGPWKPKVNPLADYLHSHWGNIETGLSFS